MKTILKQTIKTLVIEDDSEDDIEANNQDTGYRFVDLSNIKQAFQEFHDCDDAEVVLVEDENKRYGKSFVFSLQCSKCKKKSFLKTSKSSGVSWRPKDAMDINRRFVYAASDWDWQGRSGNYM